MSTLRAALSLLQCVTIPSLRHHRLRAILTLIGVVIGTQIVVAVALINRSTVASFEHTVETIAGGADLQVSNGSAGVPESLVESLAAVPGVASAAALLQGTLTTDAGSITVFAVDLFADQRIRETQFPKAHVHISDPLRFANATDSIALVSTYADRNGLALGSTLSVVGPTGKSTLTLRGLLDPVGPASLFGGAVGLVDLPTGQRLFGREGLVDQIDLRLAPGAAGTDTLARLTRVAAGSGQVEKPATRAATLGTMLGSLQTVLTLLSLNAVVVGVFIIYHTMQTAILQRTRQLAIARALGYTRPVLVLAIAIEACAFGLGGALLGALLGIASAKASLALVTGGISAIWARVDSASLTLVPTDFAYALTLGVASALLAAAAPARDAARFKVIEHLRSAAGTLPPSRNASSLLPGTVLVVLGYGLFLADFRPHGAPATIALIMTSVVLVALGYAYLAPAFVASLLAPLLTLTPRLPGLTTGMAMHDMTRDPRRARSAIAALMLAFAMVLIVNAFVRSLKGSISSWLDHTLAADLLVTPGPQLDLPSGPTLSATLEPNLRTIPGIAEVSTSRAINVRVGDKLAVLRTESVRGLRRQRYPVVEGETDFVDSLARGDIVISDNLAYIHGLRAEEHLALQTPSGPRTFRIAAVVLDYTLDIGTIIIEREAYVRLWNDELANAFRIWLHPSADVNSVSAEVANRSQRYGSVMIMTGANFKANITSTLDNALLMSYAIEIVAVLISVIGVVNFFLAEVVDRRREIGLLRSVALTRRQVQALFSAEALLIGLLGGTLAILYAWPVSMLLVTRSARLVSGWRLSFEFGLAPALATLGLAALTSVAAAYYPARQVARCRPAELVTVE